MASGVVMAALYVPFLIISAFLILIAFYRSGIVTGKRWLVQLISYILTIILVFGGLYMILIKFTPWKLVRVDPLSIDSSSSIGNYASGTNIAGII